MISATIQAKLDAIRDLPTLPAVIEKINAAVADPNMDAEHMALLLRDDPAMSARIMRVVNSALYATGSETIGSVRTAVVRLGMLGIRNVAMSAAVFSALGAKGQGTFDRQEFWRHCIHSGVAATVLHRRARARLTRFYTDDILHLAGLVHDIGRIVFDQYFHAEFVASLALCEKELMPLQEAELKVIGVDHAEVGAWLAQKWRVSEEIQQTIRWHHDPASAGERYVELAMLCHVGNYICNQQQIGWGGDAAPVYLPSVWNSLGLSPGDVSEIGAQVKAEAKGSEMLAVFG
jgi:putative nucleotidyltransferase with HDIG domain